MMIIMSILTSPSSLLPAAFYSYTPRFPSSISLHSFLISLYPDCHHHSKVTALRQIIAMMKTNYPYLTKERVLQEVLLEQGREMLARKAASTKLLAESKGGVGDSQGAMGDSHMNPMYALGRDRNRSNTMESNESLESIDIQPALEHKLSKNTQAALRFETNIGWF